MGHFSAEIYASPGSTLSGNQHSQRLTLESVLGSGEKARLREITSIEAGGSVENVTEQIHPENARLAIDVADLLGVTMAGIDLITTDITIPWHQSGARINEVNVSPQFSTQHREKEARRIIPALVVGDGRVPVHLVTGQGDILSHARKIRQKLSGRGYLFHITAAAYSEHPDGTELIMAGKSLFDRIIALTLRNDVQGIIVAEQMQTILSEGLAVDQFARAYVIDSDRHRGRQLRRVLQTRLPIRSCQLLEQKI